MKPKLIFAIALLFLFINGSFAQPGAVDPAFGTAGWVVYNDDNPEQNDDGFYQMAMQPDGKIVVYRRGYLQRYTAAGQLDLTFGNAGLVDIDFGVRDIAIQADGNILVVVGNSIYKFLGTNGALDNTWGDEGDLNIELLGVQLNYVSIALDSKGRIIVAGQATFGTAPNITKTTSVARLLADGSLDTEFNGGGIRNQIYLDSKTRGAVECGIAENDKIVISVNVAGPFDTEDIIMKYNADGKLDLTFGGGDGEILTDAKIDRLAVDADGNLAYSTSFIDADQTFLQTFLLNSDGSSIGSATLHQYIGVHGLDFQPDGKLAITGYQAGRLFVLRLNTNASFDASFGTSGIVDFIPGGRLRPKQLVWHNNRIFVAGLLNAVFGSSEIVNVADGFILALDGTDKKLKCNNLLAADLNLVADAGKCYKTLNNTNYDPVFIPSTATGDVQYKITRNGVVIDQGTGSVNGKNFQVGQTQVSYTYTDVTTQSCSYTITVSDREAPIAKAKNITVQLDATGSVIVAATDVNDGSADPCGIQSMTISKTSFDCTNVGENLVTFTVKDASNNSSTANVTVTVEDNVAPEAKTKNVTIYLDATGKASITTAQVDNGSSDACGIKSLGLSKTDFDCTNKGSNIVTLTVTDNNNNFSTATAFVNVVDDLPPLISSITPSPSLLWPSDRKMKDVTINASFTDNCPGTTYKITNVVIKEGEFAGDNINPDWEITGDHTVKLRAEIPKKGVKRVYTVTIVFTDAAGNTTTRSTDIFVAHNITSPSSGFTVKAGSTVSLAGEFWDTPGNKHTAKWLIDDKTINATVTEPSGNNNGKVTGSYKFTNAGVYKLKMNITDQNGFTTYANTAENLDAIIVVYDPNGGFAYGGGFFNSPAGALVSNPAGIGEASYGFTINYYKNATLPKGETQFEFKVGSFEFNALNFEYLAINNSMAQFRGTGKIIGGQSGVAFTMTVVDGELDGSGIDKIRMKIYNKNNGQLIYDNQPGASDAALPTQAVGANSVIVIGGGTKSSAAVINEQPIVRIENNFMNEDVAVGAFPNPHQGTFSLRVQSPVAGKMTIEYFTMTGARIYMNEQPVKAHELVIISNKGLQFSGAVFYKVSINGIIKTGKIIGKN